MKSVVTDFIIQKNKLGERITPIYLYEIQYDEISNKWLRWCTSLQSVTFDGQAYTNRTIDHGDIFETSSGLLGKITAKIGNADRLVQYYLDNYNGLKNKKFVIKIVWLEALDNPDCVVELEYYIESGTTREDIVVLDIGSAIDVLDLLVPRRIYSSSRCQVAEFKDQDCGYCGAEPYCNRSYENCDRIGNIVRTGLFPGVPLIFKEIIE